jgi:molybdenum cofactor guanylyltransferase
MSSLLLIADDIFILLMVMVKKPPITLDITALILAGGAGQRMGGIDKGWLNLSGKPLIGHILERLSNQVNQILISANRNLPDYAALGYPVLPDTLSDYPGPLAGILAGLKHAPTQYLLIVPCDCPLLPGDLADRLSDTLVAQRAELCVAHDGRHLQPTFALLGINLLPSLEAYLARGARRVDEWYSQQLMAVADCSDIAGAFINLNTPDDVRKFEHELAGLTHPWRLNSSEGT